MFYFSVRFFLTAILYVIQYRAFYLIRFTKYPDKKIIIITKICTIIRIYQRSYTYFSKYRHNVYLSSSKKVFNYFKPAKNSLNMLLQFCVISSKRIKLVNLLINKSAYLCFVILTSRQIIYIYFNFF